MDGVSDLPPTIAQLAFFAGGRFPRPDLVGRSRETGVEVISGRELVERVRDAGLGLDALGLAAGDCVALISESRPEWLLADFAVLALGAATVPIYPTLSSEQVSFILADSGARAAIVSNADQLRKVLEARAAAPALQWVVVMDEIDRDAAMAAPLRVMTFSEVMTLGHRRILDGWGVGRQFHDRAKAVLPGDLATIIYTSGTTGSPKGVMLTHANLVANLTGITQVIHLSEDDTALSFLPLCHAFERMVAYTYLVRGVSVIFAESIDTVARDLKVVRPTVMTAVPRVFEKLHARILATGRETAGVKRAVFERAVVLAETRGRVLTEGRALTFGQRIASRVAERLVYRKIRDGLGGRLRFIVSGSAPLRPDLCAFFCGAGMPILEGYGLTETSPVVTVTPLEGVVLGAVGPPLPNVEVRLADDGEVLVKGPNVMAGYFKRPAETAEVMRDGWFHTGDVGALDDRGYLKITDRKKEIIVTSGGKKIAPQPIEADLCRHPLVAEAVLVGEGRHFPAALIVPHLGALAAAMGVSMPTDEPGRRRLLETEGARRLIEPAVERVNARLAQFERIKRFALVPIELSVASGELTPTLKVRRGVVIDRCRAVIEAMYA